MLLYLQKSALYAKLKLTTNQSNLVKIDEILKKEQYEKIWQENLKQSAVKMALGHRFVCQHDNDPKYTSSLIKNYLQKFPDLWLNPIEYLWGELKRRVQARNPSNLKALKEYAKEEWAIIPQERCIKLV